MGSFRGSPGLNGLVYDTCYTDDDYRMAYEYRYYVSHTGFGRRGVYTQRLLQRAYAWARQAAGEALYMAVKSVWGALGEVMTLPHMWYC